MRPARAILAAALGLLAAAPAASAADVEFTMPGKSFSPARAAAVPGDRLVWRNLDYFNDHDIRASDGSFDSGRLGRHGSFSTTAAAPGTVTFVCSLHLGMSGAVDVVPAILEAPSGVAVAGAAVALRGRAPSGPVRIERQTADGWVAEATTHAGPSGTFDATVKPAATAAYRAVGLAGAGPAVTVRAVPTVAVAVRRTQRGLDVSVAPAPRGLTAVVQFYARERYMWRRVAHAAVPRSGRLRFRVPADVHRRARVLVIGPDGAEAARSGVVRLWRIGSRSGAPIADRPAGGPAPGHGHPVHAHMAADSHVTDVPRTLARAIRRVRRQTDVAILLPDTIRTSVRRLYPGGSGDARGYAFGLHAVRDCGGATACFVSSFWADRGERAAGRRKVRLRGGRTGWFTPTSCGASCAVPQIQWNRRGVRYGIQARVGTERTERDRLIALANSAIAAGPR
jgi:plastocyanin